MPEPPLLGSCTLPCGASLNPGVWLEQLTQLTALLVQCWSFCKRGWQRGRLLPPLGFPQRPLQLGESWMRSPWGDIGWSPPLCKRGMDRRVPFLAHKLPGTQGCLPGFEVFSPRSRGASYHSQNGQYGGCVPHKPSGRFTVAHPGQACAPSSPLVPGQVPLFEGSSRSGNTEPCGRFSVEAEAQAGGMDVEPSDGIPDLGSVWQSRGGPLCFSRVIPVPALVLPEFPDDSGHRCCNKVRKKEGSGQGWLVKTRVNLLTDKLKQVRTLHLLATSTLSVVSVFTLSICSRCLSRSQITRPSLHSVSLLEFPLHGGFIGSLHANYCNQTQVFLILHLTHLLTASGGQ